MKTFIKNNILYFYVGIFLTISYISIFHTSNYLSYNSNNIYYKQLLWYTIGLLIIYVIKKIKIETIYKYSFYIYVINIILLFGLFFFGKEINNSKAWYNVFGFSFQPSEFMKISIILLDSYTINYFFKEKRNEILLLLTLLTIFLIPSILTFFEPDTGSIICYFIITISAIYISDINKKWLKYIIIIGILFLVLFFTFYFINQELFISIFGSSFFYRIDRLINWKSKSGIQLNNSLIAIGSSGLLGHNYIPLYYPELETDFIFTSFSSVYGIIGGLLLIIIVFSFDLYLLKLIKKTPNKQNKQTIFTIMSLFLYQHIQSIGMTIGIFPITGITLPLISYGGSSIISFLILIGIINNIKKD